MVVLLLLGCSVFQPFDGTWLFRFDLNPARAGDCSGEDSGGSYNVTYTGTEDVMVDVYSGAGGELVVLLADGLVGEATGSSFEVSHKEGNTSERSSSNDEQVLVGELAAGSLSGTYTQFSERTRDDDDHYSCTVVYEYEAARLTTPPDQLAGN